MTRSYGIEKLKNCLGMNNKAVCEYLGYPEKAAWCLAGVIWFFETKLNIQLPRIYSNSKFSTCDFVKGKINTSFETAEPLDIIQYEWNPENNDTSRDDGADHVGIVLDNSDGIITVVEFNYGTNANENNVVGMRKVTYNYPYLRHIIDMSSFFEDKPDTSTISDEINTLKQNISDLTNERNALTVELQILREKIQNVIKELS